MVHSASPDPRTPIGPGNGPPQPVVCAVPLRHSAISSERHSRSELWFQQQPGIEVAYLSPEHHHDAEDHIGEEGRGLLREALHKRRDEQESPDQRLDQPVSAAHRPSPFFLVTPPNLLGAWKPLRPGPGRAIVGFRQDPSPNWAGRRRSRGAGESEPPGFQVSQVLRLVHAMKKATSVPIGARSIWTRLTVYKQGGTERFSPDRPKGKTESGGLGGSDYLDESP